MYNIYLILNELLKNILCCLISSFTWFLSCYKLFGDVVDLLLVIYCMLPYKSSILYILSKIQNPRFFLDGKFSPLFFPKLIEMPLFSHTHKYPSNTLFFSHSMTHRLSINSHMPSIQNPFLSQSRGSLVRNTLCLDRIISLSLFEHISPVFFKKIKLKINLMRMI